MRSPLPFRKTDTSFDTVLHATLTRLSAACDLALEDDDETDDELSSIIEESQRSPAKFREHLLIEVEGQIVQFGGTLDDWQREDFAALDAAWMYAAKVTAKRPLKRRGYLERPRGHSKTTDTAVMVLWAILAAPNRITGYAAAASEDQADLIIQAADKIVALNPWLEEIIDVRAGRIVNPETGSVCKVVPAKPNTIYGQSPDFIVADELTHWSDKKVWSALYSGIAKVPTSIAVIIANAGYGKGRSWQWKEREKFRVDPAWNFHSLDGVQASWLNPEDMEEQQRNLDGPEYRRLYLNKWLTDDKDGVPYSQIIDCTRVSGPLTEDLGQFAFIIGGLDIGVRHDRTSIVWLGVNVGHRKIKLIQHHTWHPKHFKQGEIQLAEVEDVLKKDINTLGKPNLLMVDNYQAIRSMQALAGRINIKEVNFSRAVTQRDMGKTFVEAFRQGWIEIYHDEWLEGDLLSIEVEYRDATRTYRLTADRDERGHADSAFALAMALMQAKVELDAWRSGIVHGETQFEEVGW